MRLLLISTWIVLIGVIASCGPGGEEAPTARTEAYFGQKPPGLQAELFAPGIVSTEESELNCVFSPDLDELFFTARRDGRNTLMTMRLREGRWTPRTVASFDSAHADVDPSFGLDGSRLYFSSTRPAPGRGESHDADLWFVERLPDGGWGDPVNLQAINSAGQDDYYTSLTSDGSLYFSRFPAHGEPGDLFWTKLVDGEYSKPEPLPAPLNTANNEHDPCIAPDGSFLVFSSDRPGGQGSNDLWVSFRSAAGEWSDPENLGDDVNTVAYEYTPTLSPDGKYLFFTRNSGGDGEIYWIDVGVVTRVRR